MSTKNDTTNEAIKADINKVLDWIDQNKPQHINQYQELILNIIRLLTNKEFRADIQALRREYNVPEKWLESDYEYASKMEEWLDWLGPDTPFTSDHKVIIDLCNKYYVSVGRFTEFIVGYLYFNDVTPYRAAPHNDIFAKNEYSHKAKIGVDNLDHPQEAYVRVFKDTTLHGLSRFIDENWELIKNLQKNLTEYPHKRVRKDIIFKRDIQILLLHILWYNSPKIQSLLVERCPPDIDIIPDESNIRKTVNDLKKEIESLNTI